MLFVNFDYFKSFSSINLMYQIDVVSVCIPARSCNRIVEMVNINYFFCWNIYLWNKQRVIRWIEPCWFLSQSIIQIISAAQTSTLKIRFAIFKRRLKPEIKSYKVWRFENQTVFKKVYPRISLKFSPLHLLHTYLLVHKLFSTPSFSLSLSSSRSIWEQLFHNKYN